MSSMERPVWLLEEPEILALLNAALDRFDQQSAEQRQRPFSLAAQKFLTALARLDASADQTWALVRELQRCGVLAIRTAGRSTYDPEWQAARLSFALTGEVILREWLQRPRVEPAMQLWRRAVEESAHRFVHGVDALLARRIAIAGRSASEVVAAIASVGAITRPVTLRQLSAFAFWGDSKVLDDRSELIATLFPQIELRERAIVVSVHLPRAWGGVLFIENQDTYTAAISGFPAECSDLALIFAAGFRSSAARVRSRAGALLHYAGPGRSEIQRGFDAWWFEEQPSFGPIWFWGDLDFAGMQILKSLKSRFIAVEPWPPGYLPMLARLEQRGGHRPSIVNAGQVNAAQAETGQTEAGQVDPIMTGCSFADEVLLPAIRLHGALDQESVFA